MADALEEIFEQTSLRVNERTKRGKFGWDISPHIARASAAREKERVSAPAPSVGKAEQQSTIPTRKTANLGRLISDYRTLVETCRARADELGISRLEIDRLGGLPVGYSGKLLGKDGGEPGRKNKKMWPIALESMLGVLGLKILLIEDEAATARTLALRTPVDRSNQRFGNVSRLTPKLLAPPTPPVLIADVSGKRRGKYGC